MRLVGYIRVSRVAGREGPSFISPHVQRDQITRQAELRGHTIVDWIEDLDQPGSRYDRPGFQRALQLVESRTVDGIAAARLDRFARSVPDGREALRRLQDVGGSLVLVAENLDTSTPIGKAMFTIMLAFAELELDRIRDSWHIARQRAISRGVHFSARVPIGYQRGPAGRLQPDPDAAPVIRELFLRRAARQSWRQIGEFMDARLPKPGGGSWPTSTLSEIIGRRTYLGEAFAGDVVNPAAHEPLVTRSEWEAAQNGQRNWWPRSDSRALLAGIIRCAGCSQVMTRASDGSRGYENYRCKIRHATGRCPEPAKISVARADAHATAAVVGWIERERPLWNATAATDTVTAAVATVEAAELELSAYRDANLVSVIGVDSYRAGLAERARAVDSARRSLADAQQQAAAGGLFDLAQRWDDLDTAEKRTVIGAAVEAVFVRRAHLRGRSPFTDRVHLLWRRDTDDVDRWPFGPFVFPDGSPG